MFHFVHVTRNEPCSVTRVPVLDIALLSEEFVPSKNIQWKQFGILDALNRIQCSLPLSCIISQSELKKKKTNFLHGTHTMFAMPHHQGRNGEYAFSACARMFLSLSLWHTDSWMRAAELKIHKRKKSTITNGNPKNAVGSFCIVFVS